MAISALATLGAGFLSAAGSVYSNTINSATQMAINDQNAKLQYQINADQIEAARMNNETAINLANTAHQREVMDLRDANLNPILSANGNGSAVPALDTPGLEAPDMQAPTISNPLSSLASSLASAVQVNDAHELNEARLGVLGMKGNPKAHVPQPDTINNLNSSLVASRLQAENDRIDLERQKIANERQMEALKTHAQWDLVGEDGLVDPRRPAYELMREGLLSDLKMRANQNFRAGINSAKQVTDAIGGIVTPIVTKGKK